MDHGLCSFGECLSALLPQMTSYQASHVTNFMRANAIATLSPRAPRNLSCAYCMPPARELTRIESTFLNRSQVSFITSGNMHSGPLMYFARARNGLPPNQHSLAASMAVKIARSKRPARGIHTTSRRGSCKTCYNRMFERGVGTFRNVRPPSGARVYGKRGGYF